MATSPDDGSFKKPLPRGTIQITTFNSCTERRVLCNRRTGEILNSSDHELHKGRARRSLQLLLYKRNGEVLSEIPIANDLDLSNLCIVIDGPVAGCITTLTGAVTVTGDMCGTMETASGRIHVLGSVDRATITTLSGDISLGEFTGSVTYRDPVGSSSTITRPHRQPKKSRFDPFGTIQIARIECILRRIRVFDSYTRTAFLDLGTQTSSLIEVSMRLYASAVDYPNTVEYIAGVYGNEAPDSEGDLSGHGVTTRIPGVDISIASSMAGNISAVFGDITVCGFAKGTMDTTTGCISVSGSAHNSSLNTQTGDIDIARKTDGFVVYRCVQTEKV